jgi:beta-N-acetylhexosaminidase
MEQGAVRAVAAGADALCLGAVIDDDAVTRVHSALVAGVGNGALREDRVREAAARVEALATSMRPHPANAARDVGAEAAARALVVEGDLGLESPPLVVELRPPASIAAGDARHGLGELLRARVQGVDVLRVTERERLDVDRDRPLVVVVRDAHRYEWEREAVERLSPAVVVETGLPLWRPANGGYVATYGGGRANLEAAADLLAGR